MNNYSSDFLPHSCNTTHLTTPTLTTEPDSLGEEEWVFLCFMVSEISAINFSDSSSSSASEPSSSSIEMANRWS